MFDRLLRQLKHLEQGIKISVELPSDAEGYLDRQCPQQSCRVKFKVLDEDWKARVKDEQAFCPICCFDAPADEWNTDEQTDYIKRAAIAEAENRIHSALEEDARIFNRNQRPGFIQLSMSVKPDSEPTILPIDAAKAMRQKFVCEVCGCRYASLGVAFFCPACGHNSAISMFDQTVGISLKVVSMASSIRNTIAAAYDDDVAQNSVRDMIEGSLGRLVGAFQHFSERLFDSLPGAAGIKRRKNVFQNLSESSDLWRKAAGKGYDTILTLAEFQELEVLFQKRHLLAHRSGIVDQEYLDRSGDKSYVLGQRLVVQDSDIVRLAELLSKLANELKK